MKEICIEQMDNETGLWEKVEKVKSFTEVPCVVEFLWWHWNSTKTVYKSEPEYRAESRRIAESYMANGRKTRIASYYYYTSEEGDWTEFDRVLWLQGEWK